ncbi:hypothetical protein Btru_011717 [Bulinus truncatus]|nr:hypothetical protein Btru_011717 [Bulinus truncatus]
MLGKDISISIPGNRPPVDHGRGVVWENTVMNSQPTYNSTMKSFASWCHFFQSGSFLGAGAPATAPERSIILEREEDLEVEEEAPRAVKRNEPTMALEVEEKISVKSPDLEPPAPAPVAAPAESQTNEKVVMDEV